MYAPVAAKARALRSSPTLEGRCCPGATRNHAGHPLVAILTDPGGPVLPADSCRPRTARSRCCDPHRPWRAGAARMGGTRARAVVQGCDPHRPWRAGAARKIRIEVVDERYVAILTDPGGPVLLAMDDATKAYLDELRSSPTLEGRCCCARSLAGSPRQRRVAILTDPGGPVLHAAWEQRGSRTASVLRSSPTLEGRCCSAASPTPRCSTCGCDPHRPWRAGAAVQRFSNPAVSTALRSSPTLEGRCCVQLPDGSVPGPLAVAILTDPGGPVLLWRAWPAVRCPGCCDPHRPWRAGAASAAASAPGPRARRCDPHRPWRAGAACRRR